MQDSIAVSHTEDARVMTHVNIAFGHIVGGRVSATCAQPISTARKLRNTILLEILLSVRLGAGGFEAATTAGAVRN